MVDHSTAQQAPHTNEPASEGNQEQVEVDIEKLADRVYRHMQRELRLLSARGSNAPADQRR